jgi:hypothetical protein
MVDQGPYRRLKDHEMDEVGAGTLASTEHQAPRPAVKGTMECRSSTGRFQGDTARTRTGQIKSVCNGAGGAEDAVRRTAAAGRERERETERGRGSREPVTTARYRDHNCSSGARGRERVLLPLHDRTRVPAKEPERAASACACFSTGTLDVLIRAGPFRVPPALGARRSCRLEAS